MNDVKLSHIPQMTVTKIVDTLADAYSKVINNKQPLTTMPSVMLWGPPGVGKSQAVRQIAQKIAQQTGKKTNVTDVRLLLFNPIDLRGIPVANNEKTLAVWLKPKIFQMDESVQTVNILFLDEISAAPQSVQAAAYQITLDRVIGEHKLPDNCIVIAAGNRVTDKSVAYKMPKALANRLLHLEVEDNFESWRNWAVANGLNSKVIGFLSFRQNFLSTFSGSLDDLAFATPRSWEMVSNVLNNVNDDVSQVVQLIGGLVGTGIATEFRTWCRVYKDLPDISKIFEGKEQRIPTGTDSLYALVSSMAAYARDHRDNLRLLENSIVYANKLPPDFSAILLRDYTIIEPDYRQKMMRIPAFVKWLNDKGKYLNGNI